MSYALEAAHQLGVIHRDLKPDNIMLLQRPGRRDIARMVTTGPGGWVTERERSYDFVKILAPDELGTDTLQGAVFGTPEYMLPEAARGDDVDLQAEKDFGGTKLSPQDAERLAKALDDALDDD